MSSWDEDFKKLIDPDNREALSSLIAQESKIGLENILTQMQRQTELYNKWSYFQFLIEAIEKKREAAYDAAVAEAKNTLREASKISVDACKDRATVDPIVQRRLAALNEAQAYHTLIKQVVKGMAQKRDMLMSINSRQKAEMELER